MNQTGQLNVFNKFGDRAIVGMVLCVVLYLAHLEYLSVYFVGTLFFWLASSEVTFQLENFEKRIPASALFISLSNLACLILFGILLFSDIDDPRPKNDLLSICAINAFSDVAQYFSGGLFGRTVAFPRISPRKTWEGYLFGMMSATIFGSLIRPDVPHVEVYVWIIQGFLGGLISSLAKRELDIKNWSGLLGEHGGFADRTDSLILPICLYIFRFLSFSDHNIFIDV